MTAKMMSSNRNENEKINDNEVNFITIMLK